MVKDSQRIYFFNFKDRDGQRIDYMAKLSNSIEEFINELLFEAGGSLEIQRSQISDHFNCAPSQINYVLTTRFTPIKGYYVESRRGGGGFIRIVKVKLEDQVETLEVFYDYIGSSITKDRSDDLLLELYREDKVTKREMEIIKVALSDRALGESENKNELRANLLKNILLVVFSWGGNNMLCDVCKERESVISYTKINENQVEEVHLCEVCAEKRFKMDFATYQDIMSKIEEALKGILKLGPQYHDSEDIACEYCNRTFTEFKNTGVLGCPHCYKAFEKEFDKYLNALNLKDGYKGKISKNADEYLLLNRKLNELKSKLDIAISMEEYEKAAELRDEIKDLKEEKNV